MRRRPEHAVRSAEYHLARVPAMIPLHGHAYLPAVPAAGADITVTVTAIQDGGVEVQVSDGVTGFIRKSDLSRDRSEQRPERFQVGQKFDAMVTGFDRSKKPTFSVKAMQIAEEKQAVAQYGSSDSGASLGDILGAALERANKK